MAKDWNDVTMEQGFFDNGKSEMTLLSKNICLFLDIDFLSHHN